MKKKFILISILNKKPLILYSIFTFSQIHENLLKSLIKYLSIKYLNYHSENTSKTSTKHGVNNRRALKICVAMRAVSNLFIQKLISLYFRFNQKIEGTKTSFILLTNLFLSKR